jgi:hypothetical protein
MVLSDDKITDEKFVDQLEFVHANKGATLAMSLLLPVRCPSPAYQAILTASYAEYPPEPDEFGPDDMSDSSYTQNSCKGWNSYFPSTHHALLPSKPYYGQYIQ